MVTVVTPVATHFRRICNLLPGKMWIEHLVLFSYRGVTQVQTCKVSPVRNLIEPTLMEQQVFDIWHKVHPSFVPSFSPFLQLGIYYFFTLDLKRTGTDCPFMVLQLQKKSLHCSYAFGPPSYSKENCLK